MFVNYDYLHNLEYYNTSLFTFSDRGAVTAASGQLPIVATSVAPFHAGTTFLDRHCRSAVKTRTAKVTPAAKPDEKRPFILLHGDIANPLVNTPQEQSIPWRRFCTAASDPAHIAGKNSDYRQVATAVLVSVSIESGTGAKTMLFHYLKHNSVAPMPFIPLILPMLLAAVVAAANEPDTGGFTRISLGLKGGLALAQHQGVKIHDMEYTVGSSMRRGMAAGMFLTLPVTCRFALQQEFLYVQKGSSQEIGVEIFDIPTLLDVSYDMDYIEIPVLLKYHWLIERSVDVYSLAGFAFALKIHDHYRLSGTVDDGTEAIPLRADSDMSEVDLFDFVFTYGLGLEVPVDGLRLLLEYRFDLSLQTLPLPTFAYVPFGDEEVRVDNEPVPLRNQCHMLLLGIGF